MDKQNNTVTKKGERGIALIVVLFALVFLSVIGLGMMYSTNMETAVNYNYRDKQVSFYGALAGLQEARERIKYPYSVTPPSSLPDAAFQNVIYIVSDASTVRPWDPTNAYFDTELCHDNTMGLTPTAHGVPCTTVPTGSSWYQVFDDSDVSAAPWNLSNPLDWKWTRIQLKANNSTPVAVNGDATSDAQSCWNGTTQMSTPSGYTTGCQPAGPVTRIAVQNGGTGYASTPTVTITGGGGTGAVGTAVLATEMTGYVSAITLTTAGEGYVTPPDVTISAGTTTATATAVLATTGSSTVTAGSVTAVTVTSAGSGFVSAPTVSFSGGGGSGAAATAVLSTTGTVATTGYVSSVNAAAAGSGYTSAPTVTLSGGGGTGATAVANLASAGSIKTITLASQGTQCYATASDAVVTFSGGGGTGATATATLEGTKSCISSVAVTSSPQCTNKLSAANGYSPIDQKAGITFAAAGQNKSFSGTLYVSSANDKTPTSLSVQNPGYDATGYSAATFTSKLELGAGAWGDCGNITVTATTGYRIASLNLTSGGSGYTSDPTVTISGGVGSTSDPTATFTRGFGIGGYTVTAGGSGYTSAPSVAVAGGSGTGATATSGITTTSTTTYPLASINVTAGGTGYTSAPTVVLTGGSGTGAAATAIVNAVTVTTYPVASINVTSGGTGYSAATPPTVTLSGGGGAGAMAIPVISTMASGSMMVDHIDITTAGSGYTSNPDVTISGGGGSGASAVAQVGGGTKYGKVWLLTSLGQTRTGARSMVQMEVASPVLGFADGGALTLDGPNPVIDAMPNSINFYLRGEDANSCSETATPDVPAITGYDDPNANPPTSSVEIITNSLPRPTHYTGAGDTPSIQNGYSSLGETMGTPAGMDSVMSAIYNAPGAHHYTSANVGTFNPDATVLTSINYVDADLTLHGSGHGRGILVVTGILTMSGNFDWDGIIFVVGEGHVEMNGGGNGQINGSIWVAKIWDSNETKNLLEDMGSPTFNWNGGGGNGIQYDHCLVTNLMTAVPMDDLHSTRPLKVLSFRTLPY